MSTEITREKLKANRTLVDITELTLWDQNPREVIDSNRVIADMRGAQTVPLLVMANGTILGGNTRFQGMQSAGKKEVWVSVIEFASEQGAIVAYINGERDIHEFKSEEDAKRFYALKNNQEYAKYLQLDVVELMMDSSLDLEALTLRVEDGQLVSVKSLLDDSNGEVELTEPDDIEIPESEENLQPEFEEQPKKIKDITYMIKFDGVLVPSTTVEQFTEWLYRQFGEVEIVMQNKFKEIKDNA
jgi:hypothetical protein